MTTVDFLYEYRKHNGQLATISYPVSIPFDGITLELAHDIVHQTMEPIMRMLDAHLGIRAQPFPLASQTYESLQI